MPPLYEWFMTKYFKIAAYISTPIIILSVISIIIITNITQSPEKQPGEKEPDARIRIALLNGCGSEGLALKFADVLRAHGFDVVNGNGGNADSFDFDTSVVVDRKGDREKALIVAEFLGIEYVLDQYSANPYTIEDVVVVLGRDWDSLHITGGE